MELPKEYVHHFVFHLLDGPSARDWFPRAQARHRWEVSEESSETHFGYCWAPLSSWGPLVKGQLCSWLKAIFHQKRHDFLQAVEKLTGHVLEAQEPCGVTKRRQESVERGLKVMPRAEVKAKDPEELPEDLEA